MDRGKKVFPQLKEKVYLRPNKFCYAVLNELLDPRVPKNSQTVLSPIEQAISEEPHTTISQCEEKGVEKLVNRHCNVSYSNDEMFGIHSRCIDAHKENPGTHGPIDRFLHYPYRLSTFINWSSSGITSPHHMAQNGLFYSGTRHILICCICMGHFKLLDNPTKLSDPIQMHDALFENCVKNNSKRYHNMLTMDTRLFGFDHDDWTFKSQAQMFNKFENDKKKIFNEFKEEMGYKFLDNMNGLTYDILFK